jgi:hypothetical protein
MGTPVTKNNRIHQSIQRKRLTPTGHKGYYSIMVEAQTSINRLSLAFTIEFRTRRNSNNCPRYPRDRLSVVKHRRLGMRFNIPIR